MEKILSKEGKAILTAEGIQNLRHVAGLAKECILERNFRYQTESRSIIAGFEFKDLPDDFFLPVYDTALMVKLIKGLTTKDAPIEVSYTVKEKQFGLSIRQLYTVVLKNPKTGKEYIISASGINWEDAKCSIAKTYIENKGASFKPKGDFFSFQITAEQLGELMGNAGNIGATLIKVINKGGKIIAEAVNDKLLDGPKYVEEVCKSEGGELESFAADFENLEKLPHDVAYTVVMSEGGCCFSSTDKKKFVIFGIRK